MALVLVILLAVATFLVQAGFHGYTAALPLDLARAGVPDASIGLIVGTAALVQIPAALMGGRLVDRFGGVRLFAAGGGAYILASAILLLPGVEAGGPVLPFLVARALQGVGIAIAMPAALSLVPGIVDPVRLGSGLAIVGAAQNLTLVVMPPLSIAVLYRTSLDGVAITAIVFVVVGLLLVSRLPIRRLVHTATPTPRRFGITFRREWAIPLAIVVTYVAHWGAVTAYLPVRAAEAGADIGLYFAADGLAIFAMRLPSGWLSDRVPARYLLVAGAAATAVAVGILLLPLTTPLLIVSGLLGGAGGAVILTPVLLELSHRSSDADRGSAFALYTGALATAMTLGSIGGAPVVALFGLSAALVLGIVLILVSIVLTLLDPSLRTTRPMEPAVPTGAMGPETPAE
jgi:MFS family permease